MATLAMTLSEAIAEQSGGANYFGGPSSYPVPILPPVPVLKMPNGPTTILPPPPTNGGSGCTGCTKKPGVIPSVPGGGITPITPPPEVLLSPGLTSGPKSTTYSQLVAAQSGDTTTAKDATMQADWWKYLVGAAIGYFIAKR